MNIEIVKDPWALAIIDNVFSDEEYELILTYCEMALYNKDVEENKDVVVMSNNFPKNIEEICIRKNNEIWDSVHDELMSISKQLQNKDLQIKENTEHTIEHRICGVGFEFPIHCDTPTKAMSNVIYVGEDGNGTCIYSTPDKFEWSVEWKENRCMSFLPQYNSWHDFRNSMNHNRHTIGMFHTYRDGLISDEEKRRYLEL